MKCDFAGKTEMAKILAQYLRGQEKDSFLHINLSDYQMKDDVSIILQMCCIGIHIFLKDDTHVYEN